MLQRLRRLVVWFPGFALFVHATLVMHVIAILHHWPRQYEDPEIHTLGSAALRSHALIANVLGVYLLPLAIVALIVLALARTRLSAREVMIFAAPVLVWMGSVVLINQVSVFYGWLWD